MKLRLLAFLLLLSTPLTADICLPGQSSQNDRNEITEEQDAELAHLLELFQAYMDLGVLERAQETLTRLHKLIERLPGESAAPLREKESALRRQLEHRQYRYKEIAERSNCWVNYGPNPPPAETFTMEKVRRYMQLARGFIQLGKFDAALAALNDADTALHTLPQDYTGRQEQLNFITRAKQLLNELKKAYYAETGGLKLSRDLRQRLYSLEDEMAKFCREPAESSDLPL